MKKLRDKFNADYRKTLHFSRSITFLTSPSITAPGKRWTRKQKSLPFRWKWGSCLTASRRRRLIRFLLVARGTTFRGMEITSFRLAAPCGLESATLPESFDTTLSDNHPGSESIQPAFTYDGVKTFRPFCRRRRMTLRPSRVRIRRLKPCVLFLLILDLFVSVFFMKSFLCLLENALTSSWIITHITFESRDEKTKSLPTRNKLQSLWQIAIISITFPQGACQILIFHNVDNLWIKLCLSRFGCWYVICNLTSIISST